MKKPGLTLEEHLQLGKDLKQARSLLQGALVKSGQAWPFTDPVHRRLEVVLDKLERARSDAEEHLFKEHPSEATTHYYYGPEDPA